MTPWGSIIKLERISSTDIQKSKNGDGLFRSTPTTIYCMRNCVENLALDHLQSVELKEGLKKISSQFSWGQRIINVNDIIIDSSRKNSIKQSESF